jgi:hypothetical protein
MISVMREIIGKVIDGKVEISTGLAEGTNVAVLAPDTEGFRLTQEQEAELLAALAEIESGSFEDGADLIAELRGRYPSCRRSAAD